jgi:hypothetical protein
MLGVLTRDGIGAGRLTNVACSRGGNHDEGDDKR